MNVDFTEIGCDSVSQRDPDTMSNYTAMAQGHLFQVFVNSESEAGDIIIKMYDTNMQDEKYLCVDLDSGGIDFLDPKEYPPTNFVLNVPASQVIKSSCELTDLTKVRKVLYKNQEQLCNRNDHLKGLFVRPPSKSNNCDQTVFSDILTLKPLNIGKLVVFQIGSKRNEVSVRIDDSKVEQIWKDLHKNEPGGAGFGRKQCAFLYEPQIFNA